MQIIKKYANGRLYDTTSKQYLTKNELASLIDKNKKIKVVLAKTGKNITKATVADLDKKNKRAKTVSYTPEKLKKWLGEKVDQRVEKLSESMNLPQKTQVAVLTSNLKKLSKKVDMLEKLQAEKIAALEKSQAKTVAEMERNQAVQLNNMEKEYESRIEDLESKAMTQTA